MAKLNLTDDQKAAVKVFMDFLVKPDEKYLIIQGAPGTGKSSLIQILHDTLQAQYKMIALLLQTKSDGGDFETVLTAATNKAANVLSDLTGMEAQTIHSFLKLTVSHDMVSGNSRLTKRKDYGLIYNKLIILDEASMINDDLFYLLDETTMDCKIVLVGDQYQLAPVRQKVSIMERLNCTKVTLNQIMRNSGVIMKTGAQFRNTVETGVFADIPDDPKLKHVDGPTFQKLIDKAFTAKTYNINSAKILAWTNDIIHAYNAHIRKLKGYPEYITAGETVFTNNPIINGEYRRAVDTPVFITEVGEPTCIDTIPGRVLTLDKKAQGFLPDNPYQVKQYMKQLAKEKAWPKFYAIKDTWLDLRPAYASTVHKSQGSSYDTVFINLSDIGRNNIASDVARLLYVAISRAVNQVYLYGKLPPKYCGTP